VVVGWQAECLLDLLVVKCADGHGAEIQGHCLKEQVLGRVSCLKVDITGSAV
jgi:hypothetical protein